METNKVTPEIATAVVEKNISKKTIVCKVSESKKTILVGHKTSKYSIGYDFGWCANPDQLDIGDTIEGFRPSGRVNVVDDEGEVVKHEDGSPVQRWVF